MTHDRQDKYAATHWREALKRNTLRTYVVISLFFMIYFSIGALVDLLIYSTEYPQASLTQIATLLATFQLFPIGTIILLAIAAASLWVSYLLYDKLMLLGTDYHEITPESAQDHTEAQLYHVVEEMKIAAGLRYMPKVFVIEADYMNAFASGYSEKSAMVAITRGLMNKLDRDELQAVMAHELSHIRHLDIKLTLTASLLANMSLIVIDLLFRQAFWSSQRNAGNRSRQPLQVLIILLRFILPIINVVLLLYLSRTRELMADAGAVELMRHNEPLARALIKIHQDHSTHTDTYAAAYANTAHEEVRRHAYLYDPSDAGIQSLSSVNDWFSTHPSLATRLKALGYKHDDE